MRVRWSSMFHVAVEVGGILVSLHWLHPWAYVEPIPLRLWLYSEEHGSDSFFWRILGLEINVPLELDR